jgi:murein DD-endopeptidase MepM/ murein hydrolase activator NlpD
MKLMKIAILVVIGTLSCKPNSEGEPSEQSSLAGLEGYSVEGSIFITATAPQGTWIKAEENGQLVNKCRISTGTTIKLSKAASREYRFNHVKISMDGKTFYSPANSDNPKGSDSAQPEEGPAIVNAPEGQSGPTSCDRFEVGSIDRALCGVSASNSQGSNNFKLANEPGLPNFQHGGNPQSPSDEPTPCELTEGYIWADHWEGNVIEKKDLVFPAGYNPLKACFSAAPGETAFGYGRVVRLHAACDLHAPARSGSPFLAMQDGMIMDVYPYDWEGGAKYGWATEVAFPAFYVRYGEHGKGTGKRGRVGSGEVIGKTGSLFYGTYHVDMLHIEFYKGSARGPLTQEGNAAYWRRSDLFNATELLRDLYKNR